MARKSGISSSLHPTGECTCAGEGICLWCKFTEARELIVELEDELRKHPVMHKDTCDAVMSSIICGRCTCGAEERRIKLVCDPDKVNGGCKCCRFTGVIRHGMIEQPCHCLEGLR
jgi:hypothetical protein